MINTIYIPSAPPGFAAPLSKELLGLSIEGDRFDDWTGPLGEPNGFTLQALKNISDRTGSPLPIRLGADSQDKYRITEGIQSVKVVLGHPPSEKHPYPEPATAGVHIGPDYFALARNLPAGTKFTIGLNLRDQDEEETYAQAKLLYDTFRGSRKEEMKDVELELVTIGNEPDLYHVPLFHRVGPPGWSPLKYIEQTISLTNGVSNIFQGNIKFQLASITGFFKDQEQWVPRVILGTGIMEEKIFERIKVYSGHMYFGDSKATSGSLMDKVFIRKMIRHWSEYRATVEAAGLEFRIGETNSLAIGGVAGISNAAEAAIWLVDYALHSACLGIKRMHFHHRIGQSYNWFDPIPITGISGGTPLDAHPTPSIHAPYYGALVVAEAIGTEPNTVIVELATINPIISAYAVYVGGAVRRVVVINSEKYLDGSRARGEEMIDLGLKGCSGTIKTLYAPLTTSTEGLTWAGQSFSNPSATPSNTPTSSPWSGGPIPISASEIIIIAIQ